MRRVIRSSCFLASALLFVTALAVPVPTETYSTQLGPEGTGPVVSSYSPGSRWGQVLGHRNKFWSAERVGNLVASAASLWESRQPDLE